MVIYIDENYHCHVDNTDGKYREVESKFFDDKCPAFIEGYCYDDSEGYVQIYPWQTYTELIAYQMDYEREKMADLEEFARIILGGETV